MAPSRPFSEEAFLASLPEVHKPGRYLGGEVNQVVKDPSSIRLRWALLYPDTYEVGMAHAGLAVLYDVLNQHPDIWAERCFAPWTDAEALLRGRSWPLTTLESRTPLAALDVLGFTLQTELSWSNILTCLDLGGVPLLARDRSIHHPLVVTGGAGTLNPEPLADFVDLCFLGDGEESVLMFSQVLLEERPRHRHRRDLLRALVERCPWLYAPSQWVPEFSGDGLAGMEALDGVRSPTRALVLDLENAAWPRRPVVPAIRIIHERISIEIMRGCVQACRFCQAGMEKRPQRWRSPARVLEIARDAYRATGIPEVGLTSLSSSDHPQLLEMMDLLSSWAVPERISVSVPSLRVNEEVREVPRRLRGQRSSGLTLAPEVATERLRRSINKNILDQDLYEGALEAWKQGISNIKLYFMMGIPTETQKDLAGILTMANRCAELRREAGVGGPGRISASVSTFIPKPLTPLQWAPQLRPSAVVERQKYLFDLPRLRTVRLKCHSAASSWVEGFLSRADRRAGTTLLAAWRNGARFDAWDERIRLDAWQVACQETGYGPEQSAWRPRPKTEVLPWDHLDLGVSREHLLEEWDLAHTGQATPHCQTEACSQCGLNPQGCADIKLDSGLFPRKKRAQPAGQSPTGKPKTRATSGQA